MNLKEISDSIHPVMKLNVFKSKLLKEINKEINFDNEKYQKIWKNIKVHDKFFDVKSSCDEAGTKIVCDCLIEDFSKHGEDISKKKSQIINIINDVRYDYTSNKSEDSNKKNFSTMLISGGLDPQTIKEKKNAQYKIPSELASYCKFLLLEYDSEIVDKLRHRLFEQVPSDELKKFVKFIEKLIYANIKDETKQIITLNVLYYITGLNVNLMIDKYNQCYNKINNVLSDILHHIRHEHKDYSPTRTLSNKGKKVNNLKKTRTGIENFDDEENPFLILNKDDAFALIGYLGQMMRRVADQWEAAVYMMEEMRQEELSNISYPDEVIIINKPNGIKITGLDKVFSESCNMLEKTIKEVNKESKNQK